MLAGRTYVPLLHARLAEMRALRELPLATKNRILPVIRIRPWLNSRNLSKVFDIIEDAFGARAYGLDLDPSRNLAADPRPAYAEFASLFNPNDGFSSYYNCVADAPNRIPVLRRASGLSLSLDQQLDRVGLLDRGLFVRVSASNPGDYLEVARQCIEHRTNNVTFIFDCGWRVDVLGLAANCTGLVNSLLSIVDNVDVVVAGSSFPDSFAGRGERFAIPVSERLLFQQVRRQVNRGELFYGDWGSTREPTDPVPMKNVPRIDVADRVNWTCWRSDDGESYSDVADRVVEDEAWDDQSELWGDYMIASTAAGIDPCIKSPAMAAAVRVNLHMYKQAHFDDPDHVVLEDEPVGEDI